MQLNCQIMIFFRENVYANTSFLRHRESFVQNCCISVAKALEISQFCTKPIISALLSVYKFSTKIHINSRCNSVTSEHGWRNDKAYSSHITWPQYQELSPFNTEHATLLAISWRWFSQGHRAKYHNAFVLAHGRVCPSPYENNENTKQYITGPWHNLLPAGASS